MKLLLSGIALLSLSACQQMETEEAITLSGITMGTSYHILIKGTQHSNQESALHNEIQKRLARINDLMSSWEETSEISLFNKHQQEKWYKVSGHTYAVLNLAQSISQQTEGAFDITVSPLIELWGFGVKQGDANLPSQKDIEDQIRKVGYQHLKLHPTQHAIKKTKRISLNISAIAKGYAVDGISRYLLEKGYRHFLVEIGGEIRAHGNKLDGRHWRIAIEKPDSLDRQVQSIVKLKDIAVATSGDYRNFFKKDNQRYSHTIDPSTGRPVKHTLSSVTVLSESSARADALATALMVMGPVKGVEFCQQHNISAYFIIRKQDDFQVEMTGEFTHYLVNNS